MLKKQMPMSTNISKLHREELLDKIRQIRTYIASAPQDTNTGNLLQYLDELTKDVKGKKYGLVFEQHRENIDETLATNTPVLSEEKNLFIDNGGEMNFLIEGDNLAALKLLEKTHKGKIDCVLIDPPYNTGEEDFIYDDNYVDKEDCYLHSKWLSFMEKRLRIAWRILSDNGFVFIHIDDNEQANLKNLCEEIFGQNSLMNVISIKMSESTGVKMTHARKRLPKLKEYILAYKKGTPLIKKIAVPKEQWDSEYKILIKNISQENLDLIKEVLYSENPTSKDIELADNLLKDVEFGSVNELFDNQMNEVEKTNILFQNAWRILRDVATTSSAKVLADNKRDKAGKAFLVMTPKKKVYIIKNGYSTTSAQPRIKLLFADNYLTVSPGDFWQDIKTTGLADEGEVEFTKGKKPLKSEMRVLEMIDNQNAVILDFFAGSGTTGHAVMALNQIDGGNRRFVLCTNNEKNICREKTFERISRVIGKEKYEASLKYYKIDFVPINDKFYYEYADDLLKHVRELVELENGINFNGNSEIAIVLNDDEMEKFISLPNNNTKILYRGHNVLLTAEQEDFLKTHHIKVNVIPNYYYNELNK